MTLLRIEYAGAFYHITGRGNEQKDIFRDDIERASSRFEAELRGKRPLKKKVKIVIEFLNLSRV